MNGIVIKYKLNFLGGHCAKSTYILPSAKHSTNVFKIFHQTVPTTTKKMFREELLRIGRYCVRN